MAFIGDGASNQGTVAESLNFSAVLKLPMIFMYENNGYSEFTGAGYHLGGADIAARAAAFGMPAEKVDGVDFFAVYDAVGRAVERARRGEGPSAVEAFAMRWYGHFEGDMQKYRESKEVDRLRKSADPLVKFEERVTREFDIARGGTARDRRGNRGADRGKGRDRQGCAEADRAPRCTPTSTGAIEHGHQDLSRGDQ